MVGYLNLLDVFKGGEMRKYLDLYLAKCPLPKAIRYVKAKINEF